MMDCKQLGFAEFDRKKVLEICDAKIAKLRKIREDSEKEWIENRMAADNRKWYHRLLNISVPNSTFEEAKLEYGTTPGSDPWSWSPKERANQRFYDSAHELIKIKRLAEVAEGEKVILSEDAAWKVMN